MPNPSSATPATMPRPTFTDRTAPFPWGLCDACGSPLAGLPGVGQYASEHQCARCAARNALRDVAEQHLQQLAAPVVGAWAAHWLAAGVPLADLDFIADHLSGLWMHDRAARTYRRATLRQLARLYRPPTLTAQQPDRFTLDAQATPRAATLAPPDPARGRDWPELRAAGGEPLNLYPGLDTLAVTLPGGDTLFVHLGHAGVIDLKRAAAVRVPAALLSEALALLDPEGRAA